MVGGLLLENPEEPALMKISVLSEGGKEAVCPPLAQGFICSQSVHFSFIKKNIFQGLTTTTHIGWEPQKHISTDTESLISEHPHSLGLTGGDEYF